MKSILEKTQSALGCAGALVAVPLAMSASMPIRTRAAVLFGFNAADTSLTMTPVSSSSGYGGTSVGVFSFTGTQLANGAVHITGSAGPVTSYDAVNATGEFSQMDGTYGVEFHLHFDGSLSGTLLANDVVTANCSVQITNSGGAVTFEQADFYTQGAFSFDNPPNFYLTGPGGSDYNAVLVSGLFTDVINAAPLGYDQVMDGGMWSMDMNFNWYGFSSGDVFSLTIPDGSIDLGISPIPEPTVAMLVLPAAVILTRRRARVVGYYE